MADAAPDPPASGRAPRAAAAALLCLATLAVCWAARPSPARAYEDQLTLGLETGYARVLSNADVPEQGPLFGIASSVGVGDVWSLRGRVSYAFHPADEPMHVAIGGLEVLYLLDVLEVVPYFGLGLDGLTTWQNGAFGADLGAHVALGVEWLPSWDWLVGLDIRPYFLPLSLDETGLDPVYLSINVRVSLFFDL